MAICAYLQVAGAPFLSDDATYITNNAKLAGLQITDLWRLMLEPYNTMEFLPLRDFSYWLDITLFGLEPAAFRMHNIILYVLCCMLVYGATSDLWRYCRSAEAADAPWAAAMVTAMFAIHPAHVEAVVWISGRKDVLSGMFSMLALWLAIRAKREQELSLSYALAALVVLLAAMLSKATAVMVSPLIALIWFVFWRDTQAGTGRRFLLLGMIGLLLAAGVTKVFISNSQIKDPSYFGIETINRTLSILGWMARLVISPENRSFFYPVFDSTQFSLMSVMGAGVLLAAAGGGVLILRKRAYLLEGIALTAFALFCLPYLQLVSYRTHSLVTDRFLFLAGWPVMFLLVSLAWRVRIEARAFLLLAVALPFCFQTITRPREWESYEALIEADVRTYPGHYVPAIFKTMTILLPNAMFNEAYATASAVKDAQFSNVLKKELDANYASFVEAVDMGSPQVAITRIRDLEAALKQPPEQFKWNSSARWAWDRSRATVAYLWRYLSYRFPEDEAVRHGAMEWVGDGPGGAGGLHEAGRADP